MATPGGHLRDGRSPDQAARDAIDELRRLGAAEATPSAPLAPPAAVGDPTTDPHRVAAVAQTTPSDRPATGKVFAVVLAVAAVVAVIVAVVAGSGGSDGDQASEGGADPFAITDEGSDFVDSEGLEVAGVDGGAPTTATVAETPTTTTTSAPPPSPAEELEAVRAADGPAVEALVGRWVPQVSSKYVGLEADGTTYDTAGILRNHLALVDRYDPEPVGLLDSTDYSTFTSDGFWVSIALVGFGTAEEANGWCDAQRIPADHCFAKLLSHTAGTSGATVGRK